MMTDCDRQLRLAAQDRQQLRLAAETLLNASINSQRSSYTQSVRTPDTVNEILIAGSRPNGRMSNVRRFFCLFVTFDLCLTVLMWLICIMISGANVQAAFLQQIVHYKMKTSLFDIVMAATCRFTILLLFYALLHMDHWIIVAVSTTSTCAFLLSKVFLYDWAQSSQPVFQVLLVITSFVLVWGEVWFLDIKVIPQESQARDWFFGYADSERAPLLSPSTIVAPAVSENVGSFYTPMDSPDHSDNEEAISRKRGGGSSPFLPATIAMKLPQDKIEECRRKAPNLLKKCHELIISENWKVERITPEGDEISYMTLPKPDGKIFKITGIIDIPAAKLINSLYDNIESSITWNKQIRESKKICVLDDDTDLVYQATGSFGKGAVSARDFVILRHKGQFGSYYISSGISVNFSTIPNRKDFIRGENGIGCFAGRDLANDQGNRCQFVWLLNTDLKLGWVPQSFLDKTLVTGLCDFIQALRKHVRTIKD